MKLELRIVEEGESERFDEISLEGRDSISRKDSKSYKLKFRGIEFDKHKIAPRAYFIKTGKSVRDRRMNNNNKFNF